MSSPPFPLGTKIPIDPPKAIIQYTPVTPEEIECATQYADDLFRFQVLDTLVCLSCAMTAKGRERIRRYEKDNSHLLPENGKPKAFVEVDQYAHAMDRLIRAETGETGARPVKALRIVQAAFPRIYSECQAARIHGGPGPGQLTAAFFKLRRINITRIPGNDTLDSESFRILGIMLWIYKQEKWELCGYDISLPRILFGALRRRKEIGELWQIVPEYDAGDPQRKKKIAEYEKRLMGKEIPCAVVDGSHLYSNSAIRLLLRLYDILDQQPYLYEVLENTVPSRDEYLQLYRLEQDTGVSSAKLIVIFTVIKQYQAEIDYLSNLNRSLVDKYNNLLTEQQNEPSDDRIAALEAENAKLRAQSVQSEKAAEAANGRERGMRAELAALGKRLRKLNEQLEQHENDRRELTELRETLYEISQDTGTDLPLCVAPQIRIRQFWRA